MRNLNVTSNVIAMFYNSTISSAINYANTVFYGSLTNQLRNELSRPWKICKKILSDSANLSENVTLYNEKLNKQATKITSDETHPYIQNIRISPVVIDSEFPTYAPTDSKTHLRRILFVLSIYQEAEI